MSTITQTSTNRCELTHLALNRDRIMDLHETVVSHILSPLPTKNVVRTSILSKDWRFKWTLSYNFDINDNCYIEIFYEVIVMDKSFVNFMDNISFRQWLKSFRLIYRTFYGLRRIQTWITTAMRHNLESLHIKCLVDGIVFPCSLLNNIWLQKLTLEFNYCTLNVSPKVCAPNLTSLDLFRVEIVNRECNTGTMTFHFPLLETFRVRGCRWLNVKSVEISAPSLTTFTSAPSNSDEEYDYFFVIHAPRLAVFKCKFGLPEKFVIENGSSIVTANWTSNCEAEDNRQLLPNVGMQVGRLLNEFTNLEVLEISDFMAEVLKLGPPLNVREKQRELTLYHPSNAHQLLDLLHAAPSLKLLRINVLEWVDYDYGKISSVPSCIVSHLEEVELNGFECETPQYNLAKFLSKNGQEMKKLKIKNHLSREEQSEIKECLSMFQSVQFVFRN